MNELTLRLRGQAGTALLTTTLDDQTTALGGHAGKEADPTLAATVRGLKRSFHDFYSFYFNLCSVENT